MLEMAAIALSVGMVAALAVIALLVYKLSGASDVTAQLNASLLAQGKAQVATDRELEQVEAARDAALREAAEADAQRDAALARLKSTEAALLQLGEQGAQHAGQRIRDAATPDDALLALHELLAPLPGVSAAGDPAAPAAGADHPKADPVRAAAGADAAKPG